MTEYQQDMTDFDGSEPGRGDVDRELTRALDALGAAERASAHSDLEARVAAASSGSLRRGRVGAGAGRGWPGLWGGLGLAACLAAVFSVAWLMTVPGDDGPTGPAVASSETTRGAALDDLMLLTAFENYDDSFTLRFKTLRAETVAVRANGWSGDVDDVLLRIEGGW